VPRLGILGVNLDKRTAEKLPYVRWGTGVVVASTVEGAIDAREGGLAPGDIIHALNRTTVRGLTDLRAMLNDLKSGDPVVLQLERHGELKYLAFTAE
jgi:S1-C subfamily serine protease